MSNRKKILKVDSNGVIKQNYEEKNEEVKPKIPILDLDQKNIKKVLSSHFFRSKERNLNLNFQVTHLFRMKLHLLL